MVKHLNASECLPIQFTTIKELSGLESKLETCNYSVNVLGNLFHNFWIARYQCKNPCDIVEYYGRSQEWVGYASPETLTLDISFVTNEVKVQEQYFIYTIVDLIGIVGGHLGLFIGFSFFDKIKQMISFFLNHFELKN